MEIARTPLSFSNIGGRAVPLGALELVPMRDEHGAVDFLVAVVHSPGPGTELLGRRLSEAVHAEAFAPLRRRIQRCLDRGEPDALRVTLPRRVFHVQLLPYTPHRVIAVWADLSEVELSASPNETNTASDAEDLTFVLVVDADGRIEHARWPAAPATASELVGQPLDRLLDPEDVRSAFASGGATTTRLIESDERSGELSVATRLVTTRLLEDGRRIVFGRDAAPEIPLATSSGPMEAERLRTMIGALVDGVGLYESVRDDDGRIVDFRCTEITGKPLLAREANLAHTLLEAFPDLVDALVFDSYVHVVTTGETWTPTPLRYVHDGQEHVYQLRAQQCGDGFVLVWREFDPTVSEVERADVVEETRGTDRPEEGGMRERGDLGHSLTERELEILRLVAIGATTAEIARTLFLSTHTVRNYVRRILARLEARSRSEAVATALTRGLIEVPTDRGDRRRRPT